VLGSEAYTPVATVATSAPCASDVLPCNVLEWNSDIKPCVLFYLWSLLV
jgi:hypothetical protein